MPKHVNVESGVRGNPQKSTPTVVILMWFLSVKLSRPFFIDAKRREVSKAPVKEAPWINGHGQHSQDARVLMIVHVCSPPNWQEVFGCTLDQHDTQYVLFTAHKIKIDYCKGLSWGGPDDQDISGLSSTIQPIRQIRSSIIEFPASLVDSSPCSHQVRRSSKARDLHRLGSLYDEWEWMSRRKQWRWPGHVV